MPAPISQRARGWRLRALSWLILATGLIVLSGCQLDVLHPQGPVGARETYLLAETSLAMLVVVLPVIFMTFFFAWRYRADATRSVYAPGWSYSGKLEFFIWSIPLAIIAFLGVIVWRSTHELDPFRPLPGNAPVLNVEVVALDWKWLFIYPDQQIATVNQLVIPTGTQIAFKITSASVMNVFFIPQLGTQIYAMAGMQTQLHLLAKNPGTFRGLSANFSGPGFSGMHFATIALSGPAFETWVKKTQAMPGDLTARSYEALAAQSTNNPVAIYGKADANLFGNILASYHGTPKLPPQKTE
jgi:cytochrome o ubiquinol oxidase subunit II